ncbi:hypothetical protein M409DRAFT_19261 [Zasmidium cellare ATCC 36951]|uniref:Phospholipase/carboxylesterase/thioesterase domain-containing protein n=1 Tax=Zasmidium cellare ATCC 36951 TaxID=1080233 RepID=A0A6A6CW69_ZASCE|nr:uncharacterized protein M409DRAFT_19261 [Zasmidium cellare ATCC 36951]KAF2170440.1 hypothetical protein M409DRAFT_19261 [Zasmidium cellare ATCC 36951]
MATLSPTVYPDPLIIPPSSGHHKASIIILHGRGSNAAAFADPLLLLSTTDHGTLQTAFPDAKLIFPIAPRSLVRRSKKASMNQWFDFWSLADPESRPEIQVQGLRETVRFLHGLITEESGVVGIGNVVLWGMSQGAAAGLVAMLLWQGEGIGAFVGMCGWLPLRGEMEGVVMEDELEDGSKKSGLSKVISRLREMLDLPSESDRRESLDVPVFIGHGEDDGTVSVRLAREAASLLERVGVEVECRMYPGLDHWYSEEMLSDIIGFVKDRVKMREVTSM